MKIVIYLASCILSLVFLFVSSFFSFSFDLGKNIYISNIAHANVTITEFNGHSAGENDTITAGPDGNIWFTELNSDSIARMTPDGVLSEFPIHNNQFNWPNSITSGSDGNLWFTTLASQNIYKITPNGTITLVYPQTFTTDCHSPNHITSGPNGNLWFTSFCGYIGQITPNGIVTTFPISSGHNGIQITSGPDGNLWFTESYDIIGKITTNGAVTEYPLPTSCGQLPSGCDSTGITPGSDGNVWFAENGAGKIARISPIGAITEFSIPSSNAHPVGLTLGDDHNLWFTEIGIGGANNVGMVTPEGVITEFPIPTYGSGSSSISRGPDGNVWFIEGAVGKIGRISITANPTPTPSPILGKQIAFVHGIKSSSVDVQAGTKEFKTLINALPVQNIHVFSYYQDIGYSQQSGGCGAQPPADTNTGTLQAHQTSVDSNICDSQSALAYNATKLDNFLSTIQSPVTIINYSMGAAITRGWLTLAQSRPNDQSLTKVDTIISIQGVQQGSFVALGVMPVLKAASWSSPLLNSIILGAEQLTNWDINRPAEEDLTPLSKWYTSANKNVPLNIHYFNFYSDIQATIRPQIFYKKLNPIGTVSFGDDVILPGDDSNPSTLSLLGGARFLPGGTQTTDKHEYRLSSTHEALIGDGILNTYLINPFQILGAGADILNDPIMHLKLNDNLNNSSITVPSCLTSAGQKTVNDEIIRILNDPAHACSL